MKAIKPSFTLNAQEDKLCRLLNQFTHFYNSAHAANTHTEKVTCRIAGGWVRDKLLGIESKDMDIAVDIMSGFDFAKELHSHVSSSSNKISTDEVVFSGHDGGTVARIKSNPERSKHLETATAHIFGIDVDFVNLRSEEYAEGSRIPHSTSFGTPLEDALRRDLTINALFFNLETGMVEDYLGGVGLEDLQKGVIRTPLDPVETFRDDPLRVLRAIRFASRFRYRVVPEIPAAAKLSDIQLCLSSVVSKERVGIELKKMMQHANAQLAIQLIIEFGIYNCVFPSLIPIIDVDMKLIETNGNNAADISKHEDLTLQCMSLFNSTSFSEISSIKFPVAKNIVDDGFIVNFACALYPKSKLYFMDGKKKNVKRPLAYHIIRDALKLSNDEAELIAAFHSNARKFTKFVNSIPRQLLSSELPNESDPILAEYRYELGMFMRYFASQCPQAKYGVNYVALAKLAVCFHCLEESSLTNNSKGEMESSILKTKQLLQAIKLLKLEEVHLKQPVMNGKQMMEMVNRGPGAWISEATAEIMAFQLRSELWLSQEELMDHAKAIVEKHRSTTVQPPHIKRIKTP